MSVHARLSPSNHRWPKCPGSVRMEEQYPNISGPAAVDGTGTHLLVETCLKESTRPSSYVGEVVGEGHEDAPLGWYVDEERAGRAAILFDYLEDRHAEFKREYPGCRVVVQSESRADPGALYGRDDWYGTCDVSVKVYIEDTLVFVEAIDYKDGRMFVKVEGNTQLTSYLGGKVFENKKHGVPENCRATVVQPKTKPMVRFEDMETKVLELRLNNLCRAAEQTDDKDAPLIPGDHCFWCKHKPHCTANTENAIRETLEMGSIAEVEEGGVVDIFNQLTADPAKFTEKELARLLDARGGFDAAFDRVLEEAKRRHSAGVPIPGYGDVSGYKTAKWNVGEEEVAKFLKGRKVRKDDIYPAKLLSPAQARKLSLSDKQKEAMEELISEVEGKPSFKALPKNKRQEKDVNEMFGDFLEEKQDPPVLELDFVENDLDELDFL